MSLLFAICALPTIMSLITLAGGAWADSTKPAKKTLGTAPQAWMNTALNADQRTNLVLKEK